MDLYPLASLGLAVVVIGGIWLLHKKQAKKAAKEAPPPVPVKLEAPPAEPLVAGHFVWQSYLQSLRQVPQNRKQRRRKKSQKNPYPI